MEVQFWEEQKNLGGRLERRVAAAKATASQNWKPPSTEDLVVMGPDADFRLHWGEHNGKPLDAILDEDPSYFEHLVGQRCNILDVYPELRLALNARNGLADDLERRRRPA